ncbi:MAG: hypothetical protein H8D67_08865 [Deltaproteobacteria bacterium]|nr:hypothetical protein [Deltaproteobacteria bacterium]
MERIIKASCRVDGTVLDPLIGSRTTGVAAMKTRRLSIGIEIERKYIEIAEQRFGLRLSEGISHFIINHEIQTAKKRKGR